MFGRVGPAGGQGGRRPHPGGTNRGGRRRPSPSRARPARAATGTARRRAPPPRRPLAPARPPPRPTRVAVAPDRVLLHEGERGRQFFVVTAGSARVDRGSTLLGRVDAGSFVGELSLLCDRSCMATVTAVTPMHLLVFAQRDFHALMD